VRRAFLAGLVALAMAGCQGVATPTPSDVEMLDTRVTVGPERTCAEMQFSDTRCTLLTLRAARHFEDARPDVDFASQELHEAGPAPAGQSPIPASQVAVAVFVFVLDDGSRIGVPVLCPAAGSTTDQTCNPQLQ
jgi:hypothetical protein